jgi:hypothetical protein
MGYQIIFMKEKERLNNSKEPVDKNLSFNNNDINNKSKNDIHSE